MLRSLPLLVLAGAAPALALVQAPVVPTDIQLPGTQPGEVSELESPNKCDNCHGGYDLGVEPAYNWRGSMMAHATRDPLFWATVAVAEQDFAGSGDLCIRCHSTEGWIGTRSTPTDGTGLLESDATGVMCDACHQMTNPDESEHLGVQFPPFLANDEEAPPEGYYGSGMYVLSGGTAKLGPYADAEPPHAFLQSRFHRSSELCGTCHDVSNPAVGDLAPNHGAQVPLEPGTFSGVPGAPVDGKAAFNNFPFQYGVVERTYSEHVASAFPTTRVGAYGSLPAELQDGAIREAWTAAVAADPSGDYVDGTQRFFTCQTCHMPPVTGRGCSRPGSPVRADLPLHDLTGGNVWTPLAIEYLDGRGELVIGGGLNAAQLQALADGAVRARATLDGAGALSLAGNTLRIVNLTGHKLISGFPEGRRMWLHVAWRDAAGALLREDGAYGPISVEIDGVPTEVETLVDLDDPHTRIWEAHMGLTQEWAERLVGWGWPTDLPLAFDRVTGAVVETLGGLAAAPAGSAHESFHFVLNNALLADNRIPPYGMRYDEARRRNILPVPAEQFGAPEPGGTYEHWDLFELEPPSGARRATIELLYQPTSWEYIRFLVSANDGSVVSLAETGERILEAWRATGMAAPAVIATAEWRAPGTTRHPRPDPAIGG